MLVTRIVAMHLCPGLFSVGRDHLAKGVIGGVEIPCHLHMRNIQRITYLVEPLGFAILGQRIANLQPWRMEQIAQCVFIFVPI